MTTCNIFSSTPTFFNRISKLKQKMSQSNTTLETELVALLTKHDKSSENVIFALYKGLATNKEITNCLAVLLKKNWIFR